MYTVKSPKKSFSTLEAGADKDDFSKVFSRFMPPCTFARTIEGRAWLYRGRSGKGGVGKIALFGLPFQASSPGWRVYGRLSAGGPATQCR